MTRRLYTPRPWQVPITNHILAHKRCAVWSTMGSGKTAATYTALDALFLGGESQPVLCLGPLRVARDVWPEDVRKWEHLSGIDVAAVTGTRTQRLAAVKRDVAVHTTNYEQLPWLIEHWGDRWPYATVVADEATRLKSLRIAERTHHKTGKKFLAGQGGKRAKALGMVAHSKIRRFIELTGTPAPNGLANLWGQLWYLDMGQRLGRTYSGFTQRWFRTSYDGHSLEPLPGAEEEIYARISDICLSVDLADYIDIAEPVVRPVYVDLPVKARALYREMEKRMFFELEGHEIEAFAAAARTQKLLQLANGAVYADPDTRDEDDPRSRKWLQVHDAKLQALESIVEEANGMPVLLGYEFKSDLARILREFPKAVDISTDAGMKAFRAGRATIGAAHPKSMGHGIDGLQDVTNILVAFGHNWDLELWLQLLGRIGPVRQMQSGHDRPVFVYQVIARDTVDEDVIARRVTKKTVQEALMDAMKRRNG